MNWFKFLPFFKTKDATPDITKELTLQERANMLTDLANIPTGGYRVSWWKSLGYSGYSGWLTVEREKDGNTTVMWTTGKDTHNSVSGRAKLVDIRPNGSLEAYYESALSLWLKWGYDRGNDDDLRNALEFAEWAQSYLIKTQK